MIEFPEAIDSSMLATYKSCPQLFFKTSMCHWKSKKEKVDLHAGRAYAKGKEVARRSFFEEGERADYAEALGLAALLEEYGDFECPADSPKSRDNVAKAYAFAMDHYPLTMNTGYPVVLPGGKRAIEVSFAHPADIDHPETGHPIILVGRGDMICNYAGANYILDDKTTKSLGATWSKQWELRGQFHQYTWGFRRMYGLPIAGCLVRGVSILKTKNDTQEAICNFSEWEIDRWYGETLEWIAEMIQCWKTKRWKYNLDHSCSNYGGCGFRDVCKMQDEKPWLEQYFERRRWDPVTRTETKL